MKTKQKGDKILDLVRRKLRKVQFDGLTLDVENGEIDKRDGTWCIPVRVSAQPQSMHRYFEVLVDIEAELSEKHHVNVWLIPTVPE